MAKARTITIHLGKEHIATHRDLLKPDARCDCLEPRGAADPNDLRLFIPREQPAGEPKWMNLLKEQFDLGGYALLNSGAGALLTLKTSNRFFAIPFGYGHNLLSDAALEQDFGLRVSLNAIDPKQLRNIDVMRPDIFALRKRQQTVLASNMGQFDVDQLMDVIRGITGKVSDKTFATTATGAHSLKINSHADVRGLIGKCAKALELFNGDQYKRHFSVIDNLRPIKDNSLKIQLDAKLVAAINSDDCDDVRLAPPEIINHADIEEFRYRGGVKRNSSTQEPLISEYRSARREAGEITVGILHHDDLAVCIEEAGADYRRWPLYKCCVFEVEHDGHRYFLSEGAWYQVDAGFYERVQGYFAERIVAIDLPATGVKEGETVYNARAARETGFLLFDRKLLSVPDSHDGFELCDLFDAERKRLIHVKPGLKGSSALSHLFRQGDWAGELLMREQVFREAARNEIREQALGRIDAIPVTKPNPTDYTFVFAVIATRRRDGNFDIPFFSKVSFKHAAQRLEVYGFKVQLGFIEKEMEAGELPEEADPVGELETA